MKSFTKIFIPFCVLLFVVTKTNAQISVSISVGTPPPALPVYVQPACPTDGYLWVPGYWAYDDNDGYYWVPGVWVAAPQPGYLWTPAYWGYEGGHYGFHAGYWGAHIGYYGGINYGYGYGGVGFVGGSWSEGHFRYNTAVVNVNTTVVHNTYIDKTVIVNNTTVNNHASFNGPGGYTARPRPEEQAAMREQHIQATNEQVSHQQSASKDRNQFASVNNGRPTATAMNHVGGHPFNGQGHTATGSTLGHYNNANRTSPNPGSSNNGGNNHPTNAPAQNNQQHNQAQPQQNHQQQQGQQQHNNSQQQHGQSSHNQQHQHSGGGQKPPKEKH